MLDARPRSFALLDVPIERMSGMTSNPPAAGQPTHRPGHLFRLPPESTVLDDPKYRPHVALTPCGGDPAGVLAYGSTQQTEAASNAVYHALKAQPTGINRNGLTQLTYVYPAIIVRPDSDALGPSIGFTKQLTDIRKAMVEALGLGKGTCRAKSAPAGSQRGKLVCVKRSIESALGTRYVLVVTGHAYSAERQYQAVVPVYDADEIDTEAMADIAVVERSNWIPRLFGGDATRAAFVVPFTHSLRHAKHVTSSTGQVVEPAEMRAVDAAIRRHFELP